MSGEFYQIIFNNQGPNCQNNSSNAAGRKNNLNYTVNWGAILPKKYKKFHCKFVFKSELRSGSLDAPLIIQDGLVSMSLGRMNSFDGVNPTKQIGLIYPDYPLPNLIDMGVAPANVVTPPLSCYKTTNNDNNDFFIDYPLDTTVNISMKTYAGALLTLMPNYVLILTLEGILMEDLDNDY
jgi:hypothetical protein